MRERARSAALEEAEGREDGGRDEDGKEGEGEGEAEAEAAAAEVWRMVVAREGRNGFKVAIATCHKHRCRKSEITD